MIRRYEILILAIPEVTQDEMKTIEADVDRLVRAGKGSLISFERWGKYRLSYPVRKNEYGVYSLVRFEIPVGSSVLEDINALFTVKLHEIIMRSVVTLLDPRRPLTYQRPKSLEESPAREVGSFMREEKGDDSLGNDGHIFGKGDGQKYDLNDAGQDIDKSYN